MENYETYILLIECDSISNGRKFLNSIENNKFDTKQDVENLICFNEHNPVATEDLMIIPLSDFMDHLNDHDSDRPEFDKFNIEMVWFGYVQIKTN